MSAPVRSNEPSASGPVAATDTSKPSWRSMYDSGSEMDSSSSTTSTRVTGISLQIIGKWLDLDRRTALIG